MNAAHNAAAPSALADLGPVLPPRGALRAKAQEAHQLILIILDETVAGGNLHRATDKMKKLQAVVGAPDAAEESHIP